MSFLAGPQYLQLPQEGGSWIIEDLLPIGGLLNIFGQPKKGKSYLALQLACAMANPDIKEILGFPVENHGPVAYLQLDTPRSLWLKRLTNLQEDDDQKEFANVFFADPQLVPYPFNILGEGYGWLQQNLKMLPEFPAVVIVDTIREAHGGDENDSGHMRNVINLLVEAVRPAALILLSHARKEWGEGGGDLMSENRGSSYIAGRMDCVLKVNENSLQFQGRTVGESRVQTGRMESGFFELSDDFVKAARDIIKTTPPETSTSDRAKMLRDRYPKKSLEACRSMIRRLEEKRLEGPKVPRKSRIIEFDAESEKVVSPLELILNPQR